MTKEYILNFLKENHTLLEQKDNMTGLLLYLKNIDKHQEGFLPYGFNMISRISKNLKKTIQANHALARLNGVAQIIPNQNIFINSLVLLDFYNTLCYTANNILLPPLYNVPTKECF